MNFLSSLLVLSFLGAVSCASYFVQYTYWTDSDCTVYAGEWGVSNDCVPLENGQYLQNTFSQAGVDINIFGYTYSNSQCSQSVSSTITTYYAECTYDSTNNQYYSAALIYGVPTTFSQPGALTTLYQTTGDCNVNDDGDSGTMWYVYEVDNSGTCYSFMNGYSTRTTSCGDYVKCSTGSNNLGTYSVNEACTSTASYSTAFNIKGYPLTTCFSGIAPTTAPTVPAPTFLPSAAPSLQESTMWLQYTYWSDSECTVYAGEQGGGGGVCYPGNGYYQLSTVTVSNGVYYVQIGYYYNAECTQLAYYSPLEYNVRCTQSGSHWYTSSLLDAIPTTYQGDGTLTVFYDTVSDCTIGTGAMYYVYMLYSSDICYQFVNYDDAHATSCGTYEYCYGDDIGYSPSTYEAVVNQCGTTSAFTSATYVTGYPKTTCYSNGVLITTNSNSNGGGSSSGRLSAGGIAAIVIL